ncbi:MAG TPA: hypothetical protein VFJ72_11270 [Rubrobacteraceae bacterium]|nr:hypothetical protein [Rubrobacteraceae bacterium]
MGSLEVRRRQGLSISAARLIPAGSFAGLAGLAALETHYFLAGLLGVGAFALGRKLLNRQENRRRELRRRAVSNVRELGRVAREDRVAASQMKRLMALQNGLLESWELLPEEYRPLLDDDIFNIVGEVEGTARLARRRTALRKHLQSLDRRGIERRIKSLERDLAGLEPGSPLRAPFESALSGRRDELAGYGELMDGISMINAQLEGAESLLGGLRGELLALDTSLAPGSLESGLVHLKERVAYFRRGLDEVTRSVETLPETTVEVSV